MVVIGSYKAYNQCPAPTLTPITGRQEIVSIPVPFEEGLYTIDEIRQRFAPRIREGTGSSSPPEYRVPVWHWKTQSNWGDERTVRWAELTLPIYVRSNTGTAYGNSNLAGYGQFRAGSEQFSWVDIHDGEAQNSINFGQHVDLTALPFALSSAVSTGMSQSAIMSEVLVDIWNGSTFNRVSYQAFLNTPDVKGSGDPRSNGWMPGNEMVVLQDTPLKRVVRWRGFHWTTDPRGINWEWQYQIRAGGPGAGTLWEIPFMPPTSGADTKRDFLSLTAIFEYTAPVLGGSGNAYPNVDSSTVTMTAILGNDYIGGDWFRGDIGPNNPGGTSKLRSQTPAEQRRVWSNSQLQYDPNCRTDSNLVNPNLFPLGQVRIVSWKMHFFNATGFFQRTINAYSDYSEQSLSDQRVVSLSRLPPLPEFVDGQHPLEHYDVFRVRNPAVSTLFGSTGIEFTILDENHIPKPFRNGNSNTDLCIDDGTWHARQFLIDFSAYGSTYRPETANASKLYKFIPIQDPARLNLTKGFGYLGVAPPTLSVPEDVAAHSVYNPTWPSWPFGSQKQNFVYWAQTSGSTKTFFRFTTRDDSTVVYRYNGPFIQMNFSGSVWDSSPAFGMWGLSQQAEPTGSSGERNADVEPTLQLAIVGRSYFGYWMSYWKAFSWGLWPRWLWRAARPAGWDRTFAGGNRNMNYIDDAGNNPIPSAIPASIPDDPPINFFGPFIKHSNFRDMSTLSLEMNGRRYVCVQEETGPFTEYYAPEYDKMYASVKRGLSKAGAFSNASQYSYYGMLRLSEQHEECVLPPQMCELTGDWFLKQINWSNSGCLYFGKLHNTPDGNNYAWCGSIIARIIGRYIKSLGEAYWGSRDDAHTYAINQTPSGSKSAWFAPEGDKTSLVNTSYRYRDGRIFLILYWIRCIYPTGPVGQRESRSTWRIFTDPHTVLRAKDGQPVLARSIGFQTGNQFAACSAATRLGDEPGTAQPLVTGPGWQQHFGAQNLIFYRRLFAYHLPTRGDFYGCDIYRQYRPDNAIENYLDCVFQEWFFDPATESLPSACEQIRPTDAIAPIGTARLKGNIALAVGPEGTSPSRTNVLDPSAHPNNTRLYQVINGVPSTHAYKMPSSFGIGDDWSAMLALFVYLPQGKKLQYAATANAFAEDTYRASIGGQQPLYRTGTPNSLSDMRYPQLGRDDYMLLAASQNNGEQPVSGIINRSFFSFPGSPYEGPIALKAGDPFETITIQITRIGGQNLTLSLADNLIVRGDPTRIVFQGLLLTDTIRLVDAAPTINVNRTGALSFTTDRISLADSVSVALSKVLSVTSDRIRLTDSISYTGKKAHFEESLVVSDLVTAGFVKDVGQPDVVGIGPEIFTWVVTRERRPLDGIVFTDDVQIDFNPSRLGLRPNLSCDELTSLVLEAEKVYNKQRLFVREDENADAGVAEFESKLAIYRSVINETITAHNSGLNYIALILESAGVTLDSIVDSESSRYLGPYKVQTYNASDRTGKGDYPDIATTFVYISRLGIDLSDYQDREFGRQSDLRSYAIHFPISGLVQSIDDSTGSILISMPMDEVNDPTFNYGNGSGRGIPSGTEAEDYYLRNVLDPSSTVNLAIQLVDIDQGLSYGPFDFDSVDINSSTGDERLVVTSVDTTIPTDLVTSGARIVLKFVRVSPQSISPVADEEFGYTAILTSEPFGTSSTGTLTDRMFKITSARGGTSYSGMTSDEFLNRFNASVSQIASNSALQILDELQLRFIATASMVANPIDGIAIQYSGLLAKIANKNASQRRNFDPDQLGEQFNSIQRILDEFRQIDYVYGKLKLRNDLPGQPFYIKGRLVT